jgi:hypothetical protein
MANVAPAHQQHRDQQHRLPADPVAEMPHQDAADGPGDKAHRKGGKGSQRAGQRIVRREELRTEDQRCGRPIEEKVVPFDRSSDEARAQDLPALPGGRNSSSGSLDFGAGRNHEDFLVD